jgi:2-dehydro-3-deoxygluconokinase
LINEFITLHQNQFIYLSFSITNGKMFDLVTAGHFAIDLISSPKITTPKPTLGGAPTYVSVAAKKMDAEVSVISKVGEDFSSRDIAWLNAHGIDLSGLKRIKGASTTRFILKYINWRRQLQLKSKAPPILSEDVPDSLRAKVVHIAPVANEISRNLVDKMRTLTNVLSLDPQGFVREFDANGNVHLKRWHDQQVLEQIDLYKSSLSEIRVVTGLTDLQLAMEKIRDYGARIVIVTIGMKGSKLLFEGKLHDIPACKPKMVRDPTGAGDAFIGAFLAEYVKGNDPVSCACIGSASASFVVEEVGPDVFGEKEEICARANKIYEKV